MILPYRRDEAPLFGEDHNSGQTNANERIDLVFVGGPMPFSRTPAIVSADRIGTTRPLASDHAGLVVKLRLQ